MAQIQTIVPRTILDARGHETLEVEIRLDTGQVGRASVPAGAFAGRHEAFRITDPEQAKRNVSSIAGSLIGQDPTNQERIDVALLGADGTEDKSALGGNVLLALSLAACEAGAAAQQVPLYQHIHDIAGLGRPMQLPTPMFNIINGGKHADNHLEIQEFMIVPGGDGRTFRQKLEIGVQLFHQLKAALHQMGHTVSVGDEGGFAPRLNSNQEAIEVIVQTINASQYQPGRDVTLALDVAASAIPDLTTVTYPLDPTSYYRQLVDTYPISILEDPLSEDDWTGWSSLTAALGGRVQIVGDDLYTTNPKRLKLGIDRAASNAIILKPDQIGTLTETFQTLRLAHQHGLTTMISHRAGETESTFIADLAVGTGTPFLKAGAPSRGERVAKYNQLLRIEESLRREA